MRPPPPPYRYSGTDHRGNYVFRQPWWERHRWRGLPVRGLRAAWFVAKRALVLVRGV